jgi:uncharacterized membrane protein
LLGKDAKSKIGVSECATANAIIPFCLVPFVLTFDTEYKSWGQHLYPLSKAKTTIVVFLLISLSLAKNFDRAAKFGIVSSSSTIFFAGIDAFMKVIAGIGSFIFFGEVIQWNSYIGFVLVVMALICLFVDKRNHMNAMRQDIEVNKKISEHRKSVSIASDSDPREPLFGDQLIINAMIEQNNLWPIEELEVETAEEYAHADEVDVQIDGGSWDDQLYTPVPSNDEEIAISNPIINDS